MNATPLIAIAVYLAIPTGMLIAFSLLLHASSRRPGKGGHSSLPLWQDLRPLEDVLVDFIAHTEVSAAILHILARRSRPLRFPLLANELKTRFGSPMECEQAPASAIRSVLSLLQMARLVRMNTAGFRLTGAGREVHRRMVSRTGATTQPVAPDESRVRHLPVRPAGLTQARELAA